MYEEINYQCTSAAASFGRNELAQILKKNNINLLIIVVGLL